MSRKAIVFTTLVVIAVYIKRCNALDRDDPIVDRKSKCMICSMDLLLATSKMDVVHPRNCVKRFDHEVLASVQNYCRDPGVFTYCTSRQVRVSTLLAILC